MAIFRHIRHPHRTWSEFQTIQDLSSLHEALRDAEAAADELTTDTHRRLVLVAASMGGWIHGESMYIYYVWYIYIIYIYIMIYMLFTQWYVIHYWYIFYIVHILYYMIYMLYITYIIIIIVLYSTHIYMGLSFFDACSF